jgi:amino acid adenylation domain-containing protein/non-ribosomal peptide synthase protein (TIGR01720 family)
MNNSSQSINNSSALTAQEQHKLLIEWNNTKADYPKYLCIHQLFEKQVEKTPDNIALVFEGQKITYQQLNDQANKLAYYLQDLGIKPEVLVGICLERSLEMIVGILGILKAGGAYIPLDPTYPKERLSFMLSDSQVQVVLTQEKFVEELSKSQAKLVCLDRDSEAFHKENIENPSSGVIPQNLAYVIYTSGSTGTPKGVLIQHQGLCNLTQAFVKLFGIEQNSRILQFASFSFDASVAEIFIALSSGGSLYLATQDSLRPGADLIQLLQEKSITHALLVPTVLAALPIEDLPNLQTLIVGGEACNLKLVAEWSKGRRVFNAYGPTESTVCATVAEFTAGETQLTIGRSIANTQIYILDNQQQPVPVGVAGELYIGGDGLARGYLNRPDLTQEKFIPHPFAETEGSRLYKTGDLARFLPDGRIEYLGRVDHQVKIRGFRIELGEIETLLNQHSDVQQAVVVTREDIPGDKRLVAYIVLKQKVAAIANTLKQFLQQKLPYYMVPAVFVILDSLPLTPNGKVDRQNLPACDRTRPDLEENFVAPRNPIEKKLTTIWTQLLGLEQIGVNDNFFHLGGHSLIAIQMLSRIREVFSIELSFQQVFTNPTISSLAQLIAQTNKEQKCQIPTIQPIPHKGLLPVSFAQERVYFIQQLAPENNAYQFQTTMRFRGWLDVTVLERCLDEIVQRHDIFRTTYPAVDGKLFQVLNPHQPISFTVIDLESFAESERETEAQKLVAAEIQKPLDITQLPLVKWVLLKLSDQNHLLIHIEHHLVHDGWSFNVFLAELVELYQAFCAGQPSPLTKPQLQFADFAHWQREWVNTPEAYTQLTYWQQKLSDSSPLLELPYDRPRPTEQTYNGDHVRMELPIDLCDVLRIFSRQEGVTLFMTMLGAFLVLLHRYTGQNDICIGTAVANRRIKEIEKLIGMIVNNLVLRTDLSGNPTFRELLSRVRQVTMDAYANEDLPFDKVVEVLKPIRNLSHNPLFQVMFSFHDSPMPHLCLPGLDISLHEPISNKSAKFDLDFLVIPRFEQSVQHGAKTGAKGITLVLEYNSDLFDAATIQALLEQYKKVLQEIVTNPDQQINKLPLLTQDQEKLLQAWNQTNKKYTETKCVHQLFASQVELTPDAIAVEQDHQQLTYRELSDRANKIAHYLQSLGVKPETLVGICLDRSLDMIAGLLGILKAGGAYITLDPTYPKERLAEIFADTQLSILLTQAKYLDTLPDYPGKTICLDADQPVIAQYSTTNPISEVQLDNLAYIIYTSGSTGKPKGVMIEHQSMANFVMTAIDEYGINAKDNILQFASVCFDTSIEEIFPGLCVGATIVLRTEEMLHSSDEFWHCCRKWQLTVLDLPTAYWHQLVAELTPKDSRIPESLKTVIIGGEEAQLSQVQHWHNCVAHFSHPPQLFNSYGPTEATVVTTLDRLTSEAISVSIGRPISNAQVYILDQYLQPVPIGVPGELHISGAGLARGYWQRPELTNEKFIQSPEGDRLYKTGDLARFRPNGNLEYLGRVDNQVKIRGFRIELGEIETVLRQFSQVLQAVVIAGEDIPGQKRLIAYIVPQNSLLSVDELRYFLKQKLPNYMIPAAFMLLESLPLTLNQKIDYNALPTPDFSRSVEDEFIAPKTLIEEKLAQIWSEILRVEKIGIHDNFFELGGDSILSIQVISRAKQAGIQIAPKQLFQYQTIAELAAVVGITSKVKAEQALVTGSVALTPIQHWFFEQKLSEPNYFNQSVLLEVPPNLQPELLQQVVQQLFVHHDALRSHFKQVGENWQQFNASAPESVPFSVINLAHLSPEEQQTAIKAADAKLQTSLNLTSGSLAQITLFQLGENQPSQLLFIIHHLVVDGISWRILLEDLATGYQQISRGEAIKFPSKTTSFQYWSDRLREYKPSADEVNYWLNESRFQVKPLPVDFPLSEEKNAIAATASVSFSLTEEETRALLQNVPAAYNTRINDVLLTALVQSFAQWTGERSLLVDLEGHGREDLFEDVDLSRTVGWFTTLFPVHLQLGEIADPGAALKLVKEQLRSLPNRGIGYGVLRYLQPDNTIRTKLQNLPQAEVSFNYLGQFDQVLKAAEVLGITKELKTDQSLLNQRSHLIGIGGFIGAKKLKMTWFYSQKIHQKSTIERLALGFMEALKTLINDALAKDSPSYTPSDFKAAKLNQEQLDKFLAKINKNSKKFGN